MDGTLLNSQHEVSPQFFKLFKKLREKNIRFAVASGRQYYSLQERLEPIKDDLIYIAENGGIVMEGGEELHRQPMSKQIVHKVIKEVRQLDGKYLILCGKKQAYIESTDPEFMEPFLNHYEKYKVVDDLLEVQDDDFLKLTLCDLKGAEEHSLPQVKHFKDELLVKLSGEIWIDFNHPQAQKGNALEAVQKIHNIDKSETIAFGDYFNDLELFERAQYSYAVANAHPDVKEAATSSTKSNDDNGVELVLQEIIDDLDK